MDKKSFAVSCALILYLSASLYATTVERLGLDELVRKSDRIVVARVADTRTHWGGAKGRLILTTYTLEVEESIKGQSPRTVEITTVGGKIGNLQLHVAGMVAFGRGERAVVFLERSGVYSTVVGLGQGKYVVTKDEVSNDITGLAFSDGRPGNNVKMPLAMFRKQIQALVLQKP